MKEALWEILKWEQDRVTAIPDEAEISVKQGERGGGFRKRVMNRFLV
jgi:hypothetical protein